ncbi:MAG: acyl-CoA reductase [Polaromonas sp.]|uniref:acyl-CoA reductase n=1 Tax=Polaromonas sp. TaxID=1869339 RepID=UPI002732CBF7|nr:acyl-CoA reductase [Polaromonas sp.]MDP2819332.1 acyl-CoA reductase [Polaromonas sp.]
MRLLRETAGYLPGLRTDELAWQTLAFESKGGRVEVAVPVLTEAQIIALTQRVRNASRSYLKSLTVAQIADIIDTAIHRLLDPQDRWRRKADSVLPRVTGYDAEMVRLGLSGYLKTFRKPQLQRFLVEDFGNPQLLDDFVPRSKGGFSKAFGPDLAVHVWAGNVPGLCLWSLISGLLVKSGTVGKVASAEPLLAGWFAQLLVEIDPGLADCLAVVWWKGGDAAQEKVFFSQADLVLAYGGNAALADVRRQVPVTTRFLPFGHKLSFGLVAASALDARKALRAAQQAAYDVVRYDQQGCYSPHVFYVARGGKISPDEFSRYLAHELSALEKKYPRRTLSLGEAADLAGWRQAEELHSLSPGGAEVAGEGDWTVVYNPSLQPLAPGALNRSVRVVAVDQLIDVIPLLAPHRAFLQTVGVAAAPRELFELAEQLGRAGVTRICALGQMTSPEAGWHHDGRFSLLDMVQMVDIDSSAEAAAETLAPYVD